MDKENYRLTYKIVKDCEDGCTLMPAAIFDVEDIGVFHLTLYFYLVRMIDESDTAKVSLKQFEKINMSKRKAIDTIRDLEKMGLISKVTRTGEDGSNLSNAYRVYHPDTLAMG